MIYVLAACAPSEKEEGAKDAKVENKISLLSSLTASLPTAPLVSLIQTILTSNKDTYYVGLMQPRGAELQGL